MNITYFQVTGSLLPCDRLIATAADDVTNVNFDFKQFVTTVGMTMDNISVMCRSSLLCCFLT